MSLRHISRLWLLGAAGCLGVLLLAAAAVWSLAKEELAEIEAVEAMRDQALEISVAVDYTLLLRQDPDVFSSLVEDASDLAAAVETIDSSAARQAAARLREMAHIGTVSAEMLGETTALAETSIASLAQQIRLHHYDVIHDLHGILAERHAQLLHSLGLAIAMVLLGALALAATALVGFGIMHRRISGPLQAIEAGMAAAGAGERDARIALPRNDELGAVAEAFNRFMEQRNRDEEALQESELRFRSIARATADVIWDLDLRNGSVWWNDGLSRIFGYLPEEIEPGRDSWTTRIHPEDRERVVANFEAAIKERRAHWQMEYRFLHKDGRARVVEDRGSLILDARGRPIRFVGGMTDITDWRHSQERLEQQAALLDQAKDAILVRGTDHRITFWNRGAERLYGWSQAEALGRSVETLLYDDPETFRTATAAVFEQGGWTGRIRQRRKDGSWLTAEANWTLLSDDEGAPRAVLAINTDISEQLAVEEQLQQAQRLEAVGQLTGGVAHDFNNLLTVILGNAEMLAERPGQDERDRQMSEMIRTAAQRGEALTSRLLAFARRQALDPKASDINALVHGMDGLLRRTLGEHIEIETGGTKATREALVDPPQLESALLNLCLNARDAMPEGGRLTIETADVELDADYAERNAEVTPGHYVLLAVSDSGEGMPAEVVARAFDPFFTTKEAGKGSGLGLSMVYGFVKQSHGHVKIYSEPNHGTTVRLYLPCAEAAASGPHAEEASEIPPGRGERVLLVEDDDMVRELVAGQLHELGYRVIQAGNGPEALAALSEAEDIALLLTDVVMPGGMNGRELAETAQARRPGLPVLFASGYSENAIVHHGRLDPGIRLLSKPFRRGELARRVRAALDAPAEKG